ncbi:MAG: hypothetical protein R3Y46_07930 [Opitutales bacterium]
MKRFLSILTVAILLLNINSYADKNPNSPLAKDTKGKSPTRFTANSLKTLVEDSLKDKQIDDTCLLGFAIYNDKKDTPTIFTQALKVGENEFTLPHNMSFKGTFDATKEGASISEFKLKSLNEEEPHEIYMSNLSTPKGFNIGTAPTMLIQEEKKTHSLLVVVFSYNNLNTENLKEATPNSSENKIPSNQDFATKKETPFDNISELLVDINKHSSNFLKEDGLNSTINLLKKHRDNFVQNKDDVCYFLLTWNEIGGVSKIKDILPLNKEENTLTASIYKDTSTLSFLGELSQEQKSIKMNMSLKQLQFKGYATKSGLQSKGEAEEAIFSNNEMNTSLNFPKDKSSGFILGEISSESISTRNGIGIRTKETKGYAIFAIHPNN